MDNLQSRNVPVPIEETEPEKPAIQEPTEPTLLPNGIYFEPDKHRMLKNGTVQDKTTGRFMSPPAPEHAPITPSNAQAVARKRWERSREAFAAGVAKGMVGREDAPTEAWGAIGTKAAELLNKATSARGFADLARFTGEAGGFVPMARGREEMQEQQENGQPQIVNFIFQYIQSKQAPPADDVIDV